MNNIIITEPSSNLRALGRNALQSKWLDAMIIVGIYLISTVLVPSILNEIFGIRITEFGNSFNPYNADFYAGIYETIPKHSSLSDLYLIAVAGPFTLGLSIVFLAMFRRQEVRTADLFLGFEKFGKALGLYLFMLLFILLWTLLFIVPGIIAAIRYSQVFYILADDPNKGIRQCMDESKAIMAGNKSKYFCLTISFIGWWLLASLAATIPESLIIAMGVNPIINILMETVTILFLAPVIVYVQSTYAGFYEILSGHLIKETKPNTVKVEDVVEHITAQSKGEIIPTIVPVETETKSEPEAEAELESESEPEAETEPEVETKPKSEAETEAKSKDVN